jgi:hypothetical protein
MGDLNREANLTKLEIPMGTTSLVCRPYFLNPPARVMMNVAIAIPIGMGRGPSSELWENWGQRAVPPGLIRCQGAGLILRCFFHSAQP